jgi:glycosyltransferase involved in cell wall biosynthesis
MGWMRILMVTEWYPENEREEFTGGVEARAYFVSREWVKLGHEVTVVCRRRGKSDWQPRGVKIIRCGKGGGVVTANWRSVIGRLRFAVEAMFAGWGVECDMVEGSNYTTYISAWIIGRLRGVPTAAWWPEVLIGRWKEHFGCVGLVWELIERLSVGLSWSVILPISKTTGVLLQKGGVKKELIYPIHLGVDEREFGGRKMKRFEVPTIITISRLVPYKRVRDVINAIALMKFKVQSSKFKEVAEKLELVTVGEGPERKNLERLVGEEGLNGRVKFYERMERRELVRLLRKSWVFCLASEVEGFGLVILEALAAGLPYVAADIPAVREITQGGEGGYLYPVGEVEVLAERLEKLLIDEKLYKRKVGEGKELIRNYSWEKSARETAEVYERVMQKSKCKMQNENLHFKKN